MMDFRDYLDLARSLVAGSREAEWRSAVSRAYYAAFHVAGELLGDLGFAVPRGEQAHGYLWLRLSNCGNATVIVAGRNLKDLRQERNRADYDGRHPFPHGSAHKLVQIAQRVIQSLDAACQEPIRTAITDAMKVYERDVLQDVTWHP